MKTRTLLLLAGCVAAALGAHDARATDRDRGGAIFVMTNSTDPTRGNELAMYRRSPSGDLALLGFFPTGDVSTGHAQLGSGPAPSTVAFGVPVPVTADGLGSQGSIAVDEDRRCVFAVNAGSDTVSSFRIREDGLELRSVADSRGGLPATFPVSLTEKRGLLYVLNGGGDASVVGLRVDRQCGLRPSGFSATLRGIADTFPMPAPGEVITGPSQVSFSPDGTRLVVSIKGGDGDVPALSSGRMVVFPLNETGSLRAPVVTEFDNAGGRGGPFGFVFAGPSTVIVNHTNTQSIGSYRIQANHKLALLSGPFPTGELAPCWSTRLGPFLFVASFGDVPATGATPDDNGLIDGFTVAPDGTLSTRGVRFPYPSPGAGRSGNHAIDILAIEKFLYFVQPRRGLIGRLTIGADGSLGNPVDFGGFMPGVEPFAGLNPGIDRFLDRCFQAGATRAPECSLGSAEGIAGY